MLNIPKKDVNALKSEVSKLFDDLGSVMQTLSDIGRQQSGEVKKKLENEVNSKIEELRERVDKARDKGKNVVSTVEEQMQENPWMALMAAFGIGFILSRLIDRK